LNYSRKRAKSNIPALRSSNYPWAPHSINAP